MSTSFTLNPPKHNSETRCYVFTIDNAPIFDCSCVTDIPFSVEPALQVRLQNFVSEFLTQAAKYFSKQLQTSVFFQRLHHEWHTEMISLPAVPAGREVERAIWIPDRILFYASRYELHWSLRGVEFVPEPTIPPGFLERGVADEELFELGANGAPFELPGQEAPLGALDADAIPLSSRFTREELERKVAERKRIRQARLRVALAQLKAERLAERYYRKYGEFEDMDDSGSELSGEEEEITLRDALASMNAQK
jgi:hypothetical protein